MARIPNGEYGTERGSSVVVSGEHGGIVDCSFDWFEEERACCECRVDPYPRHDIDRWILTWECEECGGGYAELKPQPKQEAML